MNRNRQILIVTLAVVFIAYFSAGMLWASSHNIVTEEVRYHKQLKDVKGFLYRKSGHGFAKSGRKRYNKEAAEDAWEKITVFLKKYL